MDINLWIILPISFLGFVIWVGGFVYMFLNIMRSDPREIEFRSDSNQSTGILPKKLDTENVVPKKREKKYYGSHPQFS